MFNSTKLFYVINEFFLKFEVIYWQFLKQNRDSLRIRTAQLTIIYLLYCHLVQVFLCQYFKAFFTWLKEDKNHLFKYLPW